MSIKVIIIGAGTGGLCLAQGLRASDIQAEIYERDRSPNDRHQGVPLAEPAFSGSKHKPCPDTMAKRLAP
jgi:2-polyprenyl-6-methoxyphenol hydroxylase-like FAD-dependent oxidoreductase